MHDAASGIGADDFCDAGRRLAPGIVGKQKPCETRLCILQQLRMFAELNMALSVIDDVETPQVNIEITPDELFGHFRRLHRLLSFVRALQGSDELVALHLHQKGMDRVPARNAVCRQRPNDIAMRNGRRFRVELMLIMHGDHNLAEKPSLQIRDIANLARQSQMGFKKPLCGQSKTIREPIHRDKTLGRVEKRRFGGRLERREHLKISGSFRLSA
ncbi:MULTISPECIES: hypothetical protein [unclassified Mesorhizobium]|uniref:hypothetical protein n=1 Tax=unclassified Mesorhizobium TaxID=325217 RepID=UPI00301423EF